MFKRILQEQETSYYEEGELAEEGERDGTENFGKLREELMYGTLVLVDYLSSRTPTVSSSLLLDSEFFAHSQSRIARFEKRKRNSTSRKENEGSNEGEKVREVEKEKERKLEEEEKEKERTFFFLFASISRHILLWQIRLSHSPLPPFLPISPLPTLLSSPPPLPLSLPLLSSLISLMKCHSFKLRTSADERERSAALSSLSLLFFLLNELHSPLSPSPSPSLSPSILPQWSNWYAIIIEAVMVALSGGHVKEREKREGEKSEGGEGEREREGEKEKEGGREGERDREEPLLFVRSARESTCAGISDEKAKGKIEEIRAEGKGEGEGGERDGERERGGSEKVYGYLLASLLVRLVTPHWPLITITPSPSPSPSPSSPSIKLSFATETQFLCSLLHFCNRDLQWNGKSDPVTLAPLSSLVVNIVALLIHVSDSDKMEEIGADWWRENGNTFGKIRSILNEVFLTNLELLSMCKNAQLFSDVAPDIPVRRDVNYSTIAVTICAPILRDHLAFALEDVTSATRKIIVGLFDYIIYVGKVDDFSFLSFTMEGLYHFLGMDSTEAIHAPEFSSGRRSFGELGGDALLLEFIDHSLSSVESDEKVLRNIQIASNLFIFLHASLDVASHPASSVTPTLTFTPSQSVKSLGDSFFSRFGSHLVSHFPSADLSSSSSLSPSFLSSSSLICLFLFLASCQVLKDEKVITSAVTIAESLSVTISKLCAPSSNSDVDYDPDECILTLLFLSECVLHIRTLHSYIPLNGHIWSHCLSISSSFATSQPQDPKSTSHLEMSRLTEAFRTLSLHTS